MKSSLLDAVNPGRTSYDQGGTLQSNTLYYNYPQTRTDAADSDNLINAFLCGSPIDRIGLDYRGMKEVISDEVLGGDPYRTRFETEFVPR